MITLNDLLNTEYHPDIEFQGKTEGGWDYILEFIHNSDTTHELMLNANIGQLEQLRDNAKRIYQLLEHAIRLQ